MIDSTTNPEELKIQRYEQHRQELVESGIGGLVGRLERGLDPSGMLAIKEVRKDVLDVLEKAGLSAKNLDVFTEKLHTGAIWQQADNLNKAEKDEVKAWLLLASLTHEVNDHDLTMDEYLTDVARIKEELNKAQTSDEARSIIESAVHAMHKKAQESFTMEDGVAVSNKDAHLFMALQGEKAGVVDAGGLFFVGADTLDYDRIASEQGLKKVNREDPRRKMMTDFYVDANGTDVIKVLGKGFCIIFGVDKKELAKQLARTGQELAKE